VHSTRSIDRNRPRFDRVQAILVSPLARGGSECAPHDTIDRPARAKPGVFELATAKPGAVEPAKAQVAVEPAVEPGVRLATALLGSLPRHDPSRA